MPVEVRTGACNVLWLISPLDTDLGRVAASPGGIPLVRADDNPGTCGEVGECDQDSLPDSDSTEEGVQSARRLRGCVR